MNLEVWFPAQDEVTIFLESSIADRDDEQFYETSLFCLFAARQIANGRGNFVSSSLAEVLFSLDERHPLADVEERLAGEVKVGSPTSRGGRKGFTAEFRPEARAFFKLHLHGFGLLGKGVDYYAPTSTLALLCWLLRRRKDDQKFQLALGTAAKAVGAAGVSGMISVTSQAQIAMQAAGSGWMRPDDLLPDEFDLTDEVADACSEHGFAFGWLYQQAGQRLGEAAEEMQEKGRMTILPVEVCKRVCRVEVAMAAELVDEGTPIFAAFQAVQAAEATGDETMEQTAYAHYDRVLEQTLDEEGLTPVVDALESLLFTEDAERAAGL